MLKLRPTYEEMLREAKTRRLKIQPERERRTQQGMLLDDLNFDDFDLDQYNIRNPNKATQTDIFDDNNNNNSNYSSVAPSQSINTPSEIERNEKQQRQTSTSTGESLDGVRYRTRMSIADDLATMARVGGNVVYSPRHPASGRSDPFKNPLLPLPQLQPGHPPPPAMVGGLVQPDHPA